MERVCVCVEQRVEHAHTDSLLTPPTPSYHGNGWTQEERILGNGAGRGVVTPHRIRKVSRIKCVSVFVRARRNLYGPDTCV